MATARIVLFKVYLELHNQPPKYLKWISEPDMFHPVPLPPVFMKFLDNVDGCMLDIEALASSIPFPTPSDALFAAFVLKYTNMTMELFDDLFTLFNHPEFRSETLEMKRIEDILGHISEKRRSIARDRGAERNEAAVCRQPNDTNRNGVPSLIIELVAENVESDRTPFHRILLQTYRECDGDRLLRTMCLVHRSWTDAAQRYLRRRIFASGRAGIYSLLQSPQLGPWVRDLSIRTHISFPPLEDFQPGTSYFNTPRLITEILHKCPNVTNLHLQDFYPRVELMPTLDPPRCIIHKLSDLVYLENLWLHQQFEPAITDPSSLRTMVSRLSFLKSLSLKKWTSWAPEETAQIEFQSTVLPAASISSLRNLEFLSLTDIRVYEDGPLHRLLHSLGENAPRTLQLSLTDLRASILYGIEGEPRDPRAFVRPIQSNITKLMLVEYKSQDKVTSLIENFPSLQSLCLCITVSSCSSPIVFLLPRSVRSIHIYFEEVPGEVQDACMMALLSSAPYVRKLFITYKFKGQNDNLNGLSFTATIAHCRKNNVEFDLREVDGAPSVLDM